MARILATLIGGVLLGILAMLAIARFGQSGGQSPDEITRDIVDVPKMAEAVAEQHRGEQYASLTRVEDVFALPTEFARAEALYALAGRSDSAGVQNLIFEANRIADDVERANLLNILFFRLAETDPRSALALARTDPFSAIRSVERTVWYAWARKDLDDALFVAKTQTSVAHQNSAAQNLYAAFGFMGNETTERIEAELGIGPDRSSRGRYLYRLADRSPAEAIAYINSLERGSEQQDYVSWLAYYVSLRDPKEALGHADLFRVATDGEYYRSIINGNIARENPQAAIDNMLANRNSGRPTNDYHRAAQALALSDLEAAKQYFLQARSSDERQMFGSAIISELVKRDPLEAITWARTNETGQFSYLQMQVFMRIAQTDPQLAMTEALKSPNIQMRSNMVSNVLQQIARSNPLDAIAYVDQIEDREQKVQASQQVVSSWVRSDPEAAMDWILSQDKETAAQMIRASAASLLRSDIDAVIRLLPRLDQQNQGSLRHRIAQQLATNRSPGEAQAFIQQFEGQPDFNQLQSSVISGVAQTDPLMARQLADQLVGSKARDRAYSQIISQLSQTDPAEAAAMLQSINNEVLRSRTGAKVAAQWYQHDQAAATRWVTGLPAGPSRDDAIVQMSSRWHDTTAEQQRLIASIDDPEKRGQAISRQIQNVYRTDPARARKLLQDGDITSKQRQQLEAMIDQHESRF